MKPNDKKMMVILQKDSEQTFMKLCDSNNFAFLYIHQDPSSFSSKLWIDSKRPDFLVSLPYIGSFFFDVKAQQTKFFYEPDYKKAGLKPPTAFTFGYDEIMKFKNLYHGTALPVWFAVFPTKADNEENDQVLDEEHLIPIDRVEKFIISRHESGEWQYVQVPTICFVNAKNLTQNKCKECEKKYCEKFEGIIKGEKK